MLLSLIAYISILLFVGISVYKAYKFATMPMHGRMELYPVPKEKGFEHGGSFYEEVSWWSKPHEVSHMREIVEMLKEILFIKKLFENQRPLWWISYALHLGIYMLMAWTMLLVVGVVSELNGITVAATDTGIWGLLVYYVTVATGIVGLALGTLGAGALFLRRVFDNTLKKYTTPQEYVNLLVLFAALFTGILTWGSDLSFHTAREVTANLITFTPFAASGLVTLHVILVGIMLIYIPISKMSHYVGKYFTFHKVLWDNDPNLKGSAIEHQVKKASTFRPSTSWSASHIKPPDAPTL